MKDTPSSAKDTSEDSLDKEVKDFQDWKKEYEENEKKELEKDLEKLDQRYKPTNYSETTKKSIRGGIEQPLSNPPPDDGGNSDNGNTLPAEASNEQTGIASISTDLLDEIRKANEEPDIEKRKQQVSDMNNKFQGEIKNLKTEVLPGGKGVVIYDTDGTPFEINYD